MRYLELKQNLKPFTVFTVQDIQSFEPNFHLSRLTEWQKKGYITKLIKGKYIFSDLAIKEETLFLIANELLSPSYVSLEMALSWYNLIPEGVYQITSVSTIRNINHKTPIGGFDYKNIKESAFLGYEIIEIEGNEKPYKIASIEKAILDFLYFRNDIDSMDAIEELRINTEIFNQNVKPDKMQNYLEEFHNKRLDNQIQMLIKYCQNA